jgi:glucose-6-phosphate isomerase
MKIIDPEVILDENRNLSGSKVSCYRKYMKDMRQVYVSSDGVEDDELLYTVYNDMRTDHTDGGAMNLGLTVMEPVLINGECNMTRGHFHQIKSCDEFYMGVAGNGLLMYMDRDGKTWAEKVYPGSLHYINGQYAHRLVNTGKERFKVLCCWPAVSGHDYASIEEKGFGARVFVRDGRMVIEDKKS